MNHASLHIAPITQLSGPAPIHSHISAVTHHGLEVFVLEQQFAGPANGGRDLLLEYREWIDGGRDALGSGLQGCFTAHLGLASTHALHVYGNTRARCHSRVRSLINSLSLTS